ncbi:efflux transporter, RND family, MFP subunit [Tritonibacter multivorans]|uniref:Efflux transporter, RND family, MFP subunit n=1 Tax=Tritonibacter multivorans TaxID=928856 RepID=A0A0P1G3D8_9RHOB|nr:HlyD family efflux transporter periplasmic adaptor subunit [Tritonibacter multivorans]MDA7422527.1 HlyD family efflux transporter periplasmic adaptor subunit [Tritonibacter multivorans]CUH76317.1 efflux transporter, RND family, MFP subunit [Tritonibacter multivorans]SFD39991.1 Multidrug resistance efflux pump [Tritonibacter multivorans]
MNIRHECPKPNLSYSVTAPLKLHCQNGQLHVAQRWSLTGVWLEDEDVDLQGEVTLTVPFQGIDVSFPVLLTERTEDGGFHFKDLTVRQRETLSTFYQGVLSGRMVSTEDIITSLDTPVDLVPMSETEEEEAAGRAGQAPRALRIVLNVGLFVLLAGVLAVFLGSKLLNRISHIQLDHARFQAPITEYVAPDASYVKSLHVRIGETVEPGDLLVKLSDPDRDSDVEDVRIEVLTAERRLHSAQDRLDRHIAQYAVKREDLWRAFYRLWLPLRAKDPRMLIYPPDVQRAWEAYVHFTNGIDDGPGGYWEMRALLETTVEDRQLDLRHWKRELRHRKAAVGNLVLRARGPGTVTEIDAIKNSTVARGARVVEVEDRTPRLAVAWLDDRMATHVHPGMDAMIHFSYRGERRSVPGEVLKIEAGADVARPDRYGMILTIKAEGVGVMNTRKWFGRNAPVHIALRRPMFWDRWFNAGT